MLTVCQYGCFLFFKKNTSSSQIVKIRNKIIIHKYILIHLCGNDFVTLHIFLQIDSRYLHFWNGVYAYHDIISRLLYKESWGFFMYFFYKEMMDTVEKVEYIYGIDSCYTACEEKLRLISCLCQHAYNFSQSNLTINLNILQLCTLLQKWTDPLMLSENIYS